MSWVTAGKLEAIPKRGARVLRFGEHVIALFRTGADEIYALRDACPHRGGPLSQGIVHGHCVTCPLHDWVVDLRTGLATGPDEGRTRMFDVRVRDGQVFVHVPAAESAGASAATAIALGAG